ncbi:glycosyltransferase [Streptomyces sp. NPDC049879]|uniref:glycosyltransferase n=1 Tax=Streptomyces sp. NPDC049879 TaxID=3365598 RepID=UPI0037AC02CF
MHVIDTPAMPPATRDAFLTLIGPERADRLQDAARRLRRRLDGGTLWHVNSTAAGGGVAEMLHVLVPFYRALGVPVRWAVVDGDPAFFDTTKRLGNLAYGSVQDADRLRPGDLDGYTRHLAAEADRLRTVLGPADVLLLHDHQTAGLVPGLSSVTAGVHWRCHVGVDAPTPGSREAWAALAPLLEKADGVVFSVRRHIPEELAHHRAAVIPPVLWPFAPKNEPLPADRLPGLLERCGLGPGDAPGYVLADGPRDPAAPLVVQVSRWDRLKDMHAVLTGFAAVPDAHLALIGPDPASIPDDIEQAHWFEVCRAAWTALPPGVRRRTRLVCLPMHDLDDNARLVNAAQRAAGLVVQKSLAEGFGLTVTEAMWKARPVVGSAVGGIADQIDHGRTGLLLDDPHDLAAFARLVTDVTGGAVDGAALGRRARARVHGAYLPDSDLLAVTGLLLT